MDLSGQVREATDYLEGGVGAAGLVTVVNPEVSEKEEVSNSAENSVSQVRIGGEDIIPKAVKKGRGKNKFFSLKTHPMKTRGLTSNTEEGHKFRKVIWNLEEEISKVIEKRVARGVDR